MTDGVRHDGALRVAALDCGTNSLRLLVADADPAHGTLIDVERTMEIVRLGQGVDATGRLAPEALERTLSALARFAAVIVASGAGPIRMVATSATRDAANSADFLAGVRAVLGIDPEVLSGDEEARLSFLGATAEFSDALAEPPYLVVDIGGGSTEFVLGDHGTVTEAVSVDIGCVRMTERHLRDDPPTRAQILAARADVAAALDIVRAKIDVESARTLIGLAGSVTTVAALALGLPGYDPNLIHHARVSAGQVREITRDLLRQSRAGRGRLAVMHPGRVDVIGGGAMILEALMTAFGFPQVLASEHDILDGIAWSLVDRENR